MFDSLFGLFSQQMPNSLLPNLFGQQMPGSLGNHVGQSLGLVQPTASQKVFGHAPGRFNQNPMARNRLIQNRLNKNVSFGTGAAPVEPTARDMFRNNSRMMYK